MKNSFSVLIYKLKEQLGKSVAENQIQTEQLMLQLAKKKLPINQSLLRYHEALLFICAYPADQHQQKIAENELSRITSCLKDAPKKAVTTLANTGLPYTHMTSSYSHDCIQWLNDHSQCRIELEGQSENTLNEILSHTLPTLERSNTTAGFNNQELLDVLEVKKSQRLNFYLDLLSTLNDFPSIKDYFFDKLGLEVRITPKGKAFSRTYNRISLNSTFYQQDWKRHFDAIALLNTKIPQHKSISIHETSEVILTIKNAMTLNDRETDPVTYLNPKSLRIYELERGITVALFGMTPSRQLPLESYVGFT
ncbi:MAG: hypothetical protein RIF39_16680, partial [Cyclobacteriaceae bacterium]